ncbi:PepSY-associated TM helix domain-containing protein, partial [Vibrio diabolicus]
MTTGAAEVETTHFGIVALLNDLHKGRNSGGIWKWFIDVTALLMVFFVLTGVCLLLPKKKTLRTSMQWMSFGTLLSLVIYFVAVP